MNMLNRLLEINRDLPELNDEAFPDDEQRLYRSFLNIAENKHITIPLIVSPAMKNIRFLKKNPRLIESIKKHFQDQFTSSKNSSKVHTEQIQIAEEKLMDQIPFLFFIPQSSRVQVITLRAQKKFSIRKLIYDLFPLYQDDEVELTVKKKGTTYIKVQGEVKDLTVPTEKFMQIPEGGELDMLEVELRLLKTGDFRRRHEESSNIFNAEKEVESIVNKQVQIELFSNAINHYKMPPERVVERAKLFNLNLTTDPESWKEIENLEPIDFGAKKMSDLRDILQNFKGIESNENVKSFRLRLDLELKKMENWLTRDNPVGKGGYF